MSEELIAKQISEIGEQMVGIAEDVQGYRATIARLEAQLADAKKLASDALARAEELDAALTAGEVKRVEIMVRAERAEAQLAAAREALERAAQGYRNILEFRYVGTGRYGNLTRNEVQDAIDRIVAALAAEKE